MYKTYDLKSYNLHCISNDNFKETRVVINFKRKVKKDEITIRNVLSKILLESSYNYPTSRLMTIETEELYNLTLYSSAYLSGNYSVISFQASFLNDKYVDDDLFRKAIDFIIDIITNPDVENNSFNSKSYKLVVDSLEEEISSLKDNPGRYGMMRFFEEIGNGSVAGYNAIGTLDDLKKIDERILYDYYQSMLKSDVVDIFVISPKKNDEVKQIFDDKLKLNILKKKSDSHYVSYNNYHRRNKIVHDKADFEQSKLYIGCKFDKLTDFELKYVSAIYSYILGGGPSSKLFTVIREKNSLCYSISSSFKMVYGYLVIQAGINAKDFKKCLRLTKKQIKDMANGNFSEDKIEEAIITYLNSFKEIKDSPSGILNTYVSHEYLDIDLIEERERKVRKVTKDMVVKFARKIHVDTVYVLEGSDENE